MLVVGRREKLQLHHQSTLTLLLLNTLLLLDLQKCNQAIFSIVFS
jgi:hypothetical protein